MPGVITPRRVANSHPTGRGTSLKIPWDRHTTLKYVEKVGPQFLSLRQLARGCWFSGTLCCQLSSEAVAISNLSSGLPIGRIA
jgi:hypothetical protein